MKSPKPIFLQALFPKLDNLLIELLQSLKPQDWAQTTIAGNWTVQDVAAHLLDGNLRSLSILRDNFQGDPPKKINGYPDLVQYLNGLNAVWVNAFKRVSPRVLIELLVASGPQYHAYLASLDPFATAKFSVSWAGEEESKNWFHIAREYTEKWHHQMQIRQAIGQETPLLQSALYYPYLDTSIRALPHQYRKVKPANGSIVKVVFTGLPDLEANWSLQLDPEGWKLYTGLQNTPSNCEVHIPAKIAWRIFTKGISKAEAIAQSKIIGDQSLGHPLFDLIAVMA